MNTKRCSRCKLEKPLSDFPKDKSTLSGLDHRCRQCNKKRKLIPIKDREQSFHRAAEKLWANVDCTAGLFECWNWISTVNNKGYGSLGYDGKVIGAHVLSWIIANGPIENGLFVLHGCDNPLCVNPVHLRLGTQTDNMQDCVAKRRNTRPKLTEEKVSEILNLWNTRQYSQQSIGDMFGVSQRMISVIVRREVWRHVK